MVINGIEYHRTTGYQRHDMRPHILDWNNTPRTYKIYPELPRFSLESMGSCPQKSLWALLDPPAETGGKSQFCIGTLSDVLLLSYTLTAKRNMGSQTMYYRSVPSAGALYPTELYVGSHHIKDLEPGVYYYDIHGFSLKQLRSGVGMPITSADQMALPRDDVAATILLSGIFFRSSWKYRTRAFRYVLLDTGHLLENIVAALNLYEFPHTVHYDFDDDSLHQTIGVDGKREACFVCIQLYGQTGARQQTTSRTADAPGVWDAGFPDASQVSPRENADETISTVYRLGSNIRIDATVEGHAPVTDCKPMNSFALKQPEQLDAVMPYAESILKRRSNRAYQSRPYPLSNLMQLLALMCSPMPTGSEGESSDRSELTSAF